MKIAINGFGRIGRSVFRILEEQDDIEVVAINDLFDYGALRYLLSYDTVMGPFGKSLTLEDDHFVTDNDRTAPGGPWHVHLPRDILAAAPFFGQVLFGGDTVAVGPAELRGVGGEAGADCGGPQHSGKESFDRHRRTSEQNCG